MSASGGGGDRPTPPQRPLANRGPGVRHACLFPLVNRRISHESTSGLHARQRARLARDVAEVKWALNWMHGEYARPQARSPSNAAGFEKASVLHGLTQRRFEDCCLQYLDVSRALEPEDAMVKLLKGRSVYSDAGPSANVAPFEYSSVSLPQATINGPLLRDILPAQVAKTLESFQESMLRTSEEVAAIKEAFGEPGVHHDPVFSRFSISV